MGAFEVVGHFARNAGVANHGGQVVRARLRPAFVFAKDDRAVREVMDYARLDPVQADETEAAQNFFRAEQIRQGRLVAQPVLQRHHGGVLTHQRREQFGELAVGRCLESYQHHVANADFLRCACAPGADVKIPFDAAHAHAFGAHAFIVGTQQPVRFLSVATELRAVVTAERAATDHADLHRALGQRSNGVVECGRPRAVTPTLQSRRNEKGTLKSQSALGRLGIAQILAPRIASLAALATRNFTTRLAGI